MRTNGAVDPGNKQAPRLARPQQRDAVIDPAGAAGHHHDRIGLAAGVVAAGEQQHPERKAKHPDEARRRKDRSEEHTSELQSLMRNSYAVFCLKKKKKMNNKT